LEEVGKLLSQVAFSRSYANELNKVARKCILHRLSQMHGYSDSQLDNLLASTLDKIEGGIIRVTIVIVYPASVTSVPMVVRQSLVYLLNLHVLL
jgi:hypothetical protein